MVRLQLRLDQDLHDWLEESARREYRSLNQQINLLLRQAKEREPRPPADTERS